MLVSYARLSRREALTIILVTGAVMAASLALVHKLGLGFVLFV
jgi:hypothetical protein